MIDGDNLPSPVGIGLTDLPNIGGASGPPGPPGSGITVTNNIFLDRQLETKQVLLPGQVKRKDGSWVGERQVVVSLWE